MNTAIRLLEQAAARWPDKIAVEEETGSITYGALLRRAQAIGTGLLAQGVSGPVIVYLPKSIDALAAFFGALCAGTAYVPVDAHIPMARLGKIAENLRPGCIVTHEDLLPNLEGTGLTGTLLSGLEGAIDGDAVARATAGVIDTDPIYIMYNAGSTGTPKGGTNPHRGILVYADWVVDTFGFDETTVMANQAPFYFDNSTFDIYGTLRCGGKLLLTPETLFLFPLKLPEYLEANEVTSIFWVPTVMMNVANAGALEGHPLPKLKNVAFCGEVMPNKQLNIWRRALPHCVYANLYGPTEVTVDCTCYIVDRPFADSAPLPIGKPWRGARVLLLKEDGSPAAEGEEGEICVLGSGLALGYWNALELTEKAFVQNPLNSNYPEKMYRTGDMGKWDGEDILFCGRRDSQFKMRGIRLELGDVEAAASCVEGVRRCCALFDQVKQEIVLLVETDKPYNKRTFNREMRAFAPAYMLPARFEVLDELPENANGKIDRPRLRREYGL